MKRHGWRASARPWARAGVAAGLLAAASLGAAACGITSDDAPRDISDNAVPEVLRGTTDTAVPGTEPNASAP